MQITRVTDRSGKDDVGALFGTEIQRASVAAADINDDVAGADVEVGHQFAGVVVVPAAEARILDAEHEGIDVAAELRDCGVGLGVGLGHLLKFGQEGGCW